MKCSIWASGGYGDYPYRYTEDRQTIMFSATMPKAIMDIAKNFQKDAEIIKVVRKELTVKNIEQYYYEVRPKNKNELLCRLIDIYNPRLSVVFCNTKRQVDELISELKGRDILQTEFTEI